MIRFFVIVMIFAGCLFGVKSARAQCSPGIPCTSYTVDTGANNQSRGGADANKTCNGDFMNQMISRAYLEAQRQTLVYETHIKKADSVLEYSCFDQLAYKVNQEAAPLFSETTYFQNKDVPLNIRFAAASDGPQNNPSSIKLNVSMGSGHMAPNMKAVVITPALSYINSNFSHQYLGGDGGSDFVPAAGSGYSCGGMNLVWKVAQCENIPNNAFPSFKDLISNDPRKLPQACPGGTGITQAKIDAAMNPAQSFSYVGFDKIDVKWDMFDVESGGGCPAKPIPIGLQATYYQSKTVAVDPATNPTGLEMTTTLVEEHVCPNPGCWYDADTGQCKE